MKNEWVRWLFTPVTVPLALFLLVLVALLCPQELVAWCEGEKPGP